MSVRSFGNPAASFRSRFGRTGTRASKPVLSFSASGGTKTTSGSYTIHTFLASGAFVVESKETDVEYLVIGGGGGGGFAGGGGGAGGFRTSTGFPVTPTGGNGSGSYTVTVGGGGNGVGPGTPTGVRGSISVFDTITSVGGAGIGSAVNFLVNGDVEV